MRDILPTRWTAVPCGKWAFVRNNGDVFIVSLIQRCNLEQREWVLGAQRTCGVVPPMAPSNSTDEFWRMRLFPRMADSTFQWRSWFTCECERVWNGKRYYCGGWIFGQWNSEINRSVMDMCVHSGPMVGNVSCGSMWSNGTKGERSDVR